jgi:predicted porin
MSTLKRAKFIVAMMSFQAGLAMAQSSITLYGSVDAGLSYINNVGGHAQWAAEQGNTQPDRWGLLGTEDLGGGLSSIFRLENGFSTLTGQMVRSGYIFNRQAYVGLASKTLGTFTAGHQTPFSYEWLGPLNTAVLASSYITFHPGNVDELSNTSADQIDNNVRYVSPVLYGFQFGAQFAFGNTTNFATGRNYGFALRYTSQSFKFAMTYANENDRTMSVNTLGIYPFQGVSGSSTYVADKVKNFGIGASYQIGSLLFHALYTHVRLERLSFADTYQAYDAGVNYMTSPSNSIVFGGFTTKLDGHRWTQAMLGDIYSLSKSTQIYANVAYQHATGDTDAFIYGGGLSSTSSQVAARVGIHHSF